MKIIFFGTSQFSAEVMQTLAEKYELAAVVTQPDKPVGRKQAIQQSPVAVLAAQLGLLVLKPDSLKSPEVEAQIREIAADLFVVVAYGKIIPKNILDLPKRGAINVHGSLLPKYRGASPIHAALADGQTETGITIMLMDEQVDHGPILATQAVAIGPDDTFPVLEQKLAETAQILLIKAIDGYISGTITPLQQDHDQASFTKILSKDSGKIDWHRSAQEIYNLHRAYILWPEIWTTWNNKILKIKKCQPDTADNTPGLVFEDSGKILIGSSKGSLALQEVQLEGGKAMPISEFIRGHKDFIGSTVR